MKDYYALSLALHRKFQGKLGVNSLVSVKNKEDLSVVYTPGVAEPSRAIAKDKNLAMDLTLKGRTVAVISDGSSVLGLGNIGPEAALPVMEGKALLIKEFAGLDAFPIVMDTQDSAEIIKFVRQIAPTFGAVNLEDISAPRCFQIEEELQDLRIPVFHDDQHGTAIVITAALRNAAKVVGKRFEDLKVVINGAGAAGLATAKMLLGLDCRASSCQRVESIKRVADVVVVDSFGAIYPEREKLNLYKQALSTVTNVSGKRGSLAEVVIGADVIIGVSRPRLFTGEMIKSMADKPIVFALANPEPEIMPEEAKKAGAYIVATGRSDFPNQVNNVLAFPAIFKIALQLKLTKIDMKLKVALSEALCQMVAEPSIDKILPNPFEENLVDSLVQKVTESLRGILS